MSSLKIISVCGSGTVTSSMVAMKVKDALAEAGIRATTTESNPNGVAQLLSSGTYDLIVHTSPLVAHYQLPTINAVGLLTGIGEAEFFEELLAKAKNSLNE